MIPVLDTESIRRLDKLTVERQNITFDDLMERAGTVCTNRMLDMFPLQKDYAIVCGSGNNGGDGLVIARLLAERSKNVTVYLIPTGGKSSDGFKLNRERLEKQAKATVIEVTSADEYNPEIESDIIIDAIFGSGINRPPEGIVLEVIRKINRSKLRVISIDVPSGLLTESVTETEKCIQATHTYCFSVPRFPFFFAETGSLCGDWELLDIGLDEEGLKELSNKIFLSESTDITHWLKKRNKFSHKNNFGHALMLAGSKGKCGAAILTATACLKSGAGLVTLRSPRCCVLPVQSAVPEAMVSEDPGEEFCDEPLRDPEYSVIAAGPGLGTVKATGNVLKRIFQDYKGPVVLDADALNLLSENKTWLSFMPPETILTPHPGEFKRLVDDIKDPFDRMKAQKEFSARYHCYIVLKGRYTMISCPDGTVIINPTGNPGMATAGAGDVLTGVITAFRAQGMTALASAVAGVYIHGLAGDLAKATCGERGMIASDISNHLPQAIKSFD